MLIGVAPKVPNREFMVRARYRRLLVAGGGDNIARLLPARDISDDEIEEAVERFEAACTDMQDERRAAA